MILPTLSAVYADGSGLQVPQAAYIKLPRGVDATLPIAVKKADGTPLNLSTGALILTIKARSSDSTGLITREFTVTDALNGLASAPIGASDTLVLGEGTYAYDVVWERNVNNVLQRDQIVLPGVFELGTLIRVPGADVTVPASQQPLALGPPGINWRGAYDNSVTYAANDGVYILDARGNTSSYRAMAPTIGNAPPNPTYWAPIGVVSSGGLLGISAAQFTTAFTSTAQYAEILASLPITDDTEAVACQVVNDSIGVLTAPVYANTPFTGRVPIQWWIDMDNLYEALFAGTTSASVTWASQSSIVPFACLPITDWSEAIVCWISAQSSTGCTVQSSISNPTGFSARVPIRLVASAQVYSATFTGSNYQANVTWPSQGSASFEVIAGLPIALTSNNPFNEGPICQVVQSSITATGCTVQSSTPFVGTVPVLLSAL